MENRRPLFCIVDASSFIFRAYYAVKHLSNKKGLPTNAVFGFANMILSILSELKPQYIAIVYDTKTPSFRKDLYPEYKANRGAMPEDLEPQIPYIKKFVSALGLPGFERPGFEADDVIATLAHEAAEKKHEAEVCIVTSDKDLMQLVQEGVFLYDTMKQKRTDTAGVVEKLGVKPEQVPDYLGLVGDSSDNIPGVAGVGPKTASEILQQFGSMEALYADLESVKKEGLRKKLAEHKDNAFLSKELATVKRDLQIQKDWHELKCVPTYGPEFRALLEELDFHALLRRLPGAPDSTPEAGAGGETATLSAAPTGAEDQVAKRKPRFVCIRSLAELRKAFAGLSEAEWIAVDTETTGLSIRKDELVGFSFCGDESAAYYVPLSHRDAEGKNLPDQCPGREALQIFEEFLRGRKLCGQNLKFDVNVLRNAGLEIEDEQVVFDTMVASYVLAPEERHNLDQLARKYLGHENIPYEKICVEGKAAITFDRAPIEAAGDYAAEDAYVAFLLKQEFENKLLAEPSLLKVFREIDMPLVMVIADMEWQGIAIDTPLLERLSREFGDDLAALEKKAAEVAGEEFNLASPKQLQKILFEKLGLPATKKTKTGYSTDVDVLAELASQHELPGLILEHRELAKLKGTYVDVLPSLAINGRVHAGFHQTVAATGRLSSSDPNLQNIPVRTASGRRVREAFIARKGWQLIGADYSQIELRILAHMSGDKTLRKAFQDGADIHSITAAQIFGVPLDKVNADYRRQAKAINFGLIYGKSAFSLAGELGISRMEAANIIERYFAQYPTVKAFLNGLAEKAREKGYAETLFGRRRMIENISSQNKTLRAMADRMAVNTPLQGTAADLIKLAMARLRTGLKEAGLQARLIVQVHDELLVESPAEEVESARVLVKQHMEAAGHLPGFPSVDVPLTVELNVAENWLKL